MRAIQEEHREWVNREYPGQHPMFPACGLVEEAGELVHVLLKMNQETVWGVNPRYADVKWHDELVDAIGDCAIFACSLCNAMGWDFADLVWDAERTTVIMDFSAMASAAELVKRASDVVKEYSNLRPFVMWLIALSHRWGIDFEDAVRVTWREVKQRRRKPDCDERSACSTDAPGDVPAAS